MRRKYIAAAIFQVLLTYCSFRTAAFTIANTIPGTRQEPRSFSSTQLQASSGNMFDMFRNFWNGGDGTGDGQEGPGTQEDEPAGTTTIASIPVRAIKPGGLRLFLMFFLMGMQNTPDPRTWRADQPVSEEYLVEMYFHDATGMISIELREDEVRILRCGSVPSTAYLMQESVIIQGILDELHQCAFDDTIKPEDRLLLTESENSIDMARDTLSFG